MKKKMKSKKKQVKMSSEQKNRIRIYKKLKANPELQEEIMKKYSDMVYSWLQFIMYDFVRNSDVPMEDVTTSKFFKNKKHDSFDYLAKIFNNLNLEKMTEDL